MISGQTLRVCPEGKPVSTFFRIMLQPAAVLVGTIDEVHGLPALKASRTFGQVDPDLVHQACCAAAAPD
jgi:hypothetical protein